LWTPAAIGASALHVVLAILIGRIDRREQQAIATADYPSRFSGIIGPRTLTQARGR
jgi:hypothetical protein